jgi:DNA-binding FrmR family transcriptional regulator
VSGQSGAVYYTGVYSPATRQNAVPHSLRDRTKLLNRVKRIRGQINGIERSVELDDDCGAVLQQLAACRGALNGLMAEILEDHVRYHVVDPATAPDSEQAEATEQLIDLVRAYLR